MGKIILVAGANSSGKSIFAEALVRSTAGERFYIATMVAHTEENRRRIEKHRLQRAGLGFTTLEIPCRLSEAAVPAEGVVLLEDLSNLTANAIFDENRGAESVTADIFALAERCRLLIAVTISDMPAGDYDEETNNYITALHAVNRAVYDRADAAAVLLDGEAIWQKGGAEDAC